MRCGEKSALDFLQQLAKTWIRDGVGLGSKVIMVKSDGAECTSVLDVVDMDLAALSRSNVAFSFGQETGTLEVEDDMRAPEIDPGSYNVLFASLLHPAPADMKVLKGSKKVTEPSAIVICKLHPVELRKTGDHYGVVRLCLERQGVADRDVFC